MENLISPTKATNQWAAVNTAALHRNKKLYFLV